MYDAAIHPKRPLLLLWQRHNKLTKGALEFSIEIVITVEENAYLAALPLLCSILLNLWVHIIGILPS